jgi:hypothetical protein
MTHLSAVAIHLAKGYIFVEIPKKVLCQQNSSDLVPFSVSLQGVK